MTSLRQIPSVDHLLQQPAAELLLREFGHDWLVSAIRDALEKLRSEVKAGKALPNDDAILEGVAASLEAQAQPTLRPLINATGVVLHTNLGRAPLSAEALQALDQAAAGYCSLEFDLESGKRGKRDIHAAQLLTKITGAEAALVVNNNAAAILLALSAVAKRKPVAISRAQLVEIGDGFRIPDVLRLSGAKLMEVGTTNRTHPRDFELAAEAGAAAFLYAHQSNFRIEGFTSQPDLREMADLAHAHGLPLLVDLGSGALVDTAVYGLAHEPSAQDALAVDADVVTFSGDKLLGGPQAGIVVGKAVWLEKLRKHPLYRAIRADKLCLAALSATLLIYLKGQQTSHIPIHQMLARAPEAIKEQASAWQAKLGLGEVISGFSTVGGGSLPGETLPTWLLAFPGMPANNLMARLRAQPFPIIARIQDDMVVLDPRTVLPGQEAMLLEGLTQAILPKKDRE